MTPCILVHSYLRFSGTPYLYLSQQFPPTPWYLCVNLRGLTSMLLTLGTLFERCLLRISVGTPVLLSIFFPRLCICVLFKAGRHDSLTHTHTHTHTHTRGTWKYYTDLYFLFTTTLLGLRPPLSFAYRITHTNTHTHTHTLNQWPACRRGQYLHNAL